MGFEVGGIDHECIWWAIVCRQIAENLVENAHLGPATEAVVKGLMRPILARVHRANADRSSEQR